jgi:sialic acid synthase SpsE
VIAEAGANHNNSVERAVEMAAAAAGAGAWAIKFQLYKAERLASRESPKYWSDEVGTSTQLEAFRLSDHLEYSRYGEVAAACRDLGIVFFATPFDATAIAALEEINVPLYKVASADITDRPLLEELSRTGKPVLLSTGASTLAEVEQAVDWLGGGPEKVVLLACTLAYPTPDADANFARIEGLRNAFPSWLIGMSDHTLGPEGAWMAGALGACCIEKHFTLDPSLPDIPDHAMSVTPPQLAEMVQACDRAAVMRGSDAIEPIESEQAARASARRSLVLVQSVAAGARIEDGMLTEKRPGTGIPPSERSAVVGLTALRDLESDQVLSWDDVSGPAR